MPFDAQLVGTCLASLVVGALLATVLRPSPGPRSVSKPPSEDVPDSKVEESEEEDESADDIGPCKMILVVRMDLKMGKGKIAAQCGHATLGAYQAALRTHKQFVEAWEDYGQKKVAVKVKTEEEMDAVAERARAAGLPHYIVVDAGHTQIAPGSRTVLGIGPAPESAFRAVTGSLKLL